MVVFTVYFLVVFCMMSHWLRSDAACEEDPAEQSDVYQNVSRDSEIISLT